MAGPAPCSRVGLLRAGLVDQAAIHRELAEDASEDDEKRYKGFVELGHVDSAEAQPEHLFAVRAFKVVLMVRDQVVECHGVLVHAGQQSMRR